MCGLKRENQRGTISSFRTRADQRPNASYIVLIRSAILRRAGDAISGFQCRNWVIHRSATTFMAGSLAEILFAGSATWWLRLHGQPPAQFLCRRPFAFCSATPVCPWLPALWSCYSWSIHSALWRHRHHTCRMCWVYGANWRSDASSGPMKLFFLQSQITIDRHCPRQLDSNAY